VEDQNGFWLRRVYLTYESDISDKFKARARLEFNSPGNFSTSAANIVPYLKDATISYQYAPLHKLTVGIQDSLAYGNIEKFYGYRHLEKDHVRPVQEPLLARFRHRLQRRLG